MKEKFFFILYEIFIFSLLQQDNICYLTKGYYEINLYLTNLYLSTDDKKLIISNIKFSFHIFPIEKFIYIIKYGKKKVGIDDNNNIIIYYDTGNIDINKYSWNIVNIKKNLYFIQNLYNKKFIEVSENCIQLSKNTNNEKKFIFNFFKLFEKGLNQTNYLKIINSDPIDVIIKYIDLSDKTLNRTGINQIYKDENCEELRYSIRSILQYIPWVRKIFIIMPNEKIKFLRNEINDKIIYIKDKEILGFDSANSPAFTFNLFQMSNFGVSKNFIYMDDDCFIGQKIKKSDLFYFDEKYGDIVPYIISNKFFTISKNEIYNEYYEYMKRKDNIHPHSGDGFNLEKLCTQKFFIDYFNKSLINCQYTHNAYPENIKDLRDIYDFSQKYKYFKEMIYSKERFIFSFYHQMLTNLYQLNVNYRKVHYMRNKYISVEKIKIKIKHLNSSLFVINTGGNHEPIFRQKKLLKKILTKRFPIPARYEIQDKEYKFIDKRIKYLIMIFIIFLLLKIKSIFNDFLL